MVRIRLRRVGAKKQPSYRIVVADQKAPRDGRFIEVIGHYNPRTDPPTVVIFEDRALHWLTKGAQPSEGVARFFGQLGLYDKAKKVHAGAGIEEVAAPRVVPEQGRPTKAGAPGRSARRKKDEAEAGVEESPVAATEEVVDEAPAEELAAAAAAAAAAEPEPAPTAEPEPAPTAVPEPAPTAVPEAAAAAVPTAEAGAELAPAELSLEDLELSARFTHVLQEAGIETAAQLIDALSAGDDQLLAISGIGPKAVEEIRGHLAEKGLGPDAR